MAASLHPAALPVDELCKACRFTQTRRGGPGGQHRNKVETAVIVTHAPTSISAEASERRSAADNRRAALFRLRLKLAIGVRQSREKDDAPSELWQSRSGSGRLTVSSGHADFPALLAEALDVSADCDFELRAAAERLGVTASQLTKLFRAAPEALVMVNSSRAERGLRPLK